MNSFDWKKNVKDSIKYGLIINTADTRIFFALKAVKVKPSKATLEVMDIIKLAGGICGRVLVKDYAIYNK